MSKKRASLGGSSSSAAAAAAAADESSPSILISSRRRTSKRGSTLDSSALSVSPKQQQRQQPQVAESSFSSKRQKLMQAAADGDVDAADFEETSLKSMFPCIVKVFCISCDPDYCLPWQMNKQYSSTSTGFLIGNRQILTNAHSVDNFTQVKVRRRGSPTKFIAKVLAIGRDCDMALLTVEDDAFWKDKPPFIDIEKLKRDHSKKMLPNLEDKVAVVGYPVGGENLSVTAGVVSRIDMQEYTMGDYDLLAVQVDAAINPGNSGGPVFDIDNEFIGIAFQALKDGTTENCGYIIPFPVVLHFLEDVRRNKKYTGFCSLNFSLQKLEDSTMRQYLGLKTGQGGVLVGKVGPLSPAHDLLKVGDVLLEIDGIPVASDGTVQFPANWTRGSLELNGSSVKSSSSSQSKRKGGVKEEIITDEEEEGDVAGGNGSASMAVDEEWEDEEEEEIGNVPRRYDNDMDMDAFERIDLGFLISQKFVGDKANLKILRNPALVKEEEEQREKSKQDYISKEKENQVFLPLDIPKSIGLPAAKPSEMEVEIPLRGRDTLVPREGTRTKEGNPLLYLPSYYIVNGFCFVPLNEMYFVSEFGAAFDQDAPIELLNSWLHSAKRYHDEEIVLLSHVLAHNVNTGYEGLQHLRLVKINNQQVLNLKHCCMIVEGIVQQEVDAIGGGSKKKGAAAVVDSARFIKLEFQGGCSVIIRVKDIIDHSDSVLKQHGVPRSKSEDLD